MSMSDRGGRTVIYEQIGTRGDDNIIQRSFGDLRVCAIGEGLSANQSTLPSSWASRASRLVLETERPNDVRRMEFESGRVSFTVNGNAAAIDGAAAQWRDALLGVLDATWELSQLHGQVSTLRGEISTLHGERSTLQGEIATLRGEVSTMRGEISTVRGRESSLRGEISTLRGHLASLQGEISSERGAISSLQSARYDLNASDRGRLDDRIRQHEKAIRDIEADIQRFDVNARVREVEQRINALNPDREVADIERRIREFDVERRIAEVNARLDGADVDKRVAAIETQINALDADRRGAAIESRRDAAVERLKAALR
jgi:chromosome segregation ATPase